MTTRGGGKPAIDYDFTVGAARPGRVPHPKERHTALVDAVLVTEKDGTAVTLEAPDGVATKKLASVLRQAVQRRALRESLAVKVEARVQGQTISLWVVAAAVTPLPGPDAQTPPPPPAVPPPAPAAPAQSPVGETALQSAILSHLLKAGPDGLMVEEIARLIHGKKPEAADLTLVRTAIGTLSRKGRLLVDSASRYSLNGASK